MNSCNSIFLQHIDALNITETVHGFDKDKSIARTKRDVDKWTTKSILSSIAESDIVIQSEKREGIKRLVTIAETYAKKEHLQKIYQIAEKHFILTIVQKGIFSRSRTRWIEDISLPAIDAVQMEKPLKILFPKWNKNFLNDTKNLLCNRNGTSLQAIQACLHAYYADSDFQLTDEGKNIQEVLFSLINQSLEKTPYATYTIDETEGDAEKGTIMNYPYASFSWSRKEINEDRFLNTTMIIQGESVPLFAVFDGHGGMRYHNHEVAEFMRIELPLELNKALSQLNSVLDDASLRQSIENCFESLQKKIHENRNWATVGSTAAIAMIIGNRFVIINVGNSRIALHSGGTTMRLTEDLTPTNPRLVQKLLAARSKKSTREGLQFYKQGFAIDDQARIKTALYNSRNECQKVWDFPHSENGPTMGDHDFYNDTGTGLTLPMQPQILISNIPKKASYLVLTTDGINLTSQQIGKRLDSQKKNPAKDLVIQSRKSGSYDDITATVVALPRRTGKKRQAVK